MDRLEVKFVSIVQRGVKGCEVTARLYRLGDPVVTAEGVRYPRVLLRTVSATLGPVQPWTRFADLLRERAEAFLAQHGLTEIVCSL